MASPAEELPEELWVQILQHVPNDQRLSACALVCHKLARAAAAATQSVEVSCFSQQRHDAFLSWVSSHGRFLTYLKLSSSFSFRGIRQLPCPNLLELHVHNCSVQLCAGGSDLGLLHSCTALTRLDLSAPKLLDGGVPMPAEGVPAAAAQLQHLTLAYGLPAAPDGEGRLVQALQHRLLPHLTYLTCLDLTISPASNGLLEPCFLQHISTMAKLKQLSLMNAEPIDASTLPGIERLTALAHLSLSDCELEPSYLLSVTTSLTSFYLESVTLQPEHAQQDGALGTSHLLQLLARLTALRELTLGEVAGDWPQQLSLYSALTASSNLQVLNINGCSIHDAAWEHVFPDGRKLPHLRSAATYGSGTGQGHPPGCADLTFVFRCCPALKSLDHGPTTDAQLDALGSLTSLTRLELGPVSQSAVNHVTGLSQLQDLDMHIAVAAQDPGDEEAGFGLRDLIPLTALTRLTNFSSDVKGRPQQEEEEGAPEFVLDLRSDPGDAGPPVWVQLLERCAEDPAAQPAVTSSMLQQLHKQQGQIVQLQQQHTEELEASRNKAAELRERVQALEGQLQEVLAVLRQLLPQA